MKNAVLAALAALVVGCGSTMTLEEMEAAEKVAATTVEREELRAKIDQFYQNWESANLYFENREACDNNKEFTFVCDNVQPYKQDVGKLTPDAKVRAWKKEYQSCGCLTREQANYLLRDIRRQMSPSLNF